MRLANGHRLAVSIAATLACAAALVHGAVDSSKLPPPADRTVDFVKDVQPIFQASCSSCHGAEKQKSGFRLDVKQVALAGGDLGKGIIPGKSAESPLIHYVAGLDEKMRMPAEGEPLTAEQVGVLRAWIDQGAAWPDSASVQLADPKKEHWAYQPLVAPAVPAVQDAAWVRNPIDAFVLSKLQAAGMKPSPEADRRTLIRRVYFNLTGLPPTPEEVKAFVDDPAPDAYEKVVDRLLASPRYGERWARHWIDVVHFAETHGNDQDRIRPNAWPYRDYLIRSFNEDKPYTRFVEEQLAGDVLYPDDPQGTVALGFLGAGPWDESSQMSIQDGTVDKLIARNLDRDDMLTTTMSTFASSTVHCARCHNHKFDPVSQAEYYNLQASFAGVDRAERPYEPDPEVARQRRDLLARQAQLQGDAATLAPVLLSADAQAKASEWEQSLGSRDSAWRVLDPTGFVSGGGERPTKQSDGSILFGGATPAKDSYTIVASTDLKQITAVRLEVLADDALPHKGPGRQPGNGNLHLSEFRAIASPLAGAEAPRDLKFARAVADFEQEAWTAAHAIDGNPGTAWGVDPKEGESHAIMFELKEPVPAYSGGTIVTFVLEQFHGGSHLIGRPRLSVTDVAQLEAAAPLPATVEAILRTPAAQRTDAQRAEVALVALRDRVARQLDALPKPQMVFAGTTDFKADGNFTPAKGPRPVFVLKRGDVTQPGEPAVPGGLSCVPALEPTFALPNPNDEGARRAALAQWLSDPRNVLTWRSIVNRAWHYNYGRGIVDTPNDLGLMGGVPSHPELVDWLAVWFRDNGTSLKRLHRLMLTSSTYRQASAHNAEYAKVDGDNRLLWRMNRVRLDAECVRDAVLQATGKLDLTMGGPSAKQFIETAGKHVTPDLDYANFNPDDPANYRRSVYRFLFRTLPDPFMESMDCPNHSQLTPVRSTSVTALQALAMLNDRFIVRQCEHLAERARSMRPEMAGQIDAIYQLTLNRSATPKEIELLSAYGSKHGMATVCRVVLNSTEFMFVN